ncbi:hydrogenase maturation protease [Nocardioides guangzhouensis]|uniref:Hydrogenase maturation protease n=1 Tax=Nocardioides guangzhouensis TaxID=2497878 RepID=A0A4Q4Z5I8_9ACTN|nr:hydrogenase maturation protease [Nocardioides guangzhouensis]RYP83040.1 hydrogenase maturation protease [Nocardioides guangzhouensis]
MLLVGIGNPDRGDDGVGPVVADRVAALDLPGVEAVTEAAPLAVVERLQRTDGCAALVVVDATRPGPEPGRVRVLTVGTEPLAGLGPAPASSHGLGLSEALELARALGVLPPRVTVVGIEAGSVAVGAGLSDAVRASVDDAVAAVLAEAAVRPPG